MADLGAVGKYHPDVFLPVAREFPNYAVTDLASAFANMSGIVGGTVLENGVELADCEVIVFWRPSMARIGRTWTDSAGNWEVGGLDPTKTEHYTVVIKDKDGGTVYNDAIYALIAPV